MSDDLGLHAAATGSGEGGPPSGSGEAPPAAPLDARRQERSGFLEALVLVLVALVLALTLKTYVAEAYEIKGRSMKETFENGEKVVVLKSFYEIQRGDIIVFASAEDASKDLIKRVVGLPGERLAIKSGKVLINGKRLDENYALPDHKSHRELLIPRDSYFVMGDNRPDSHDSRDFHSVPAVNIKGKVVMRWWPFDKVTAF